MLTFVALMVMIWAKHDGEEITQHVVEAFIIAVTIIVVAIPEVRRKHASFNGLFSAVRASFVDVV